MSINIIDSPIIPIIKILAHLSCLSYHFELIKLSYDNLNITISLLISQQNEFGC